MTNLVPDRKSRLSDYRLAVDSVYSFIVGSGRVSPRLGL